MKETYSMEEVTFMYSKATVNKAEWENETYETVKGQRSIVVRSMANYIA